MGQSRLERRVDVFILECDLPFAGFEALLERVQSVTNRRAICVGNESLRSQHFRVRDRASDVVTDEPGIEDVIFAGRVSQHALVQRQSFFPQAAHVSSSPCSAGVSASVLLTTSVPVPSLVKTSSSRLSANL